ncbi:Response regulator containing a CheY-like receiver domain and a GGDEF domain [Butyrivibrio fibrisolvens 16/4]|nr:Response regulator containing a CheY-like receiver domain and a GGDEF domain [Butyrivibrio fibrisolvens 16/4]
MKAIALKSGEQLLEYISTKESPQLILLDIRMSGMDGYETLTKLREIEEVGCETPVIFLTGEEEEEAEIRGLSLGAMDFIRKPFVPGVLALRVKHAMELISLQKDLAGEVEKRQGKMKNCLFRWLLPLQMQSMQKMHILTVILAAWLFILKR